MSNLNIICKSDKTEFTNYFSEPLTFPVNAEISLVKANLTVPVIAQEVLTIPVVALADRGDVWIDVILDGIQESFTWTDLYDTWIALTGADQELGAGVMTPAVFFSGFYQFFLNNPIEIIDGADIYQKTSFQETFAKMLNDKYAFYKVTPVTTWKRTETDIQVASAPASWWQGIGGIPGAVARVTPVRALNWGISSIYNPRGISGRNPQPVTLLPANNTNWTIAANKLTSIGGGAAGVYHNLHYATNDPIDPNGGFYKFNKNTAGTGICAIGVKVNSGNVNGTRVPATLTDTTIIDVGFEFGRDAANTVRCINGYKELTAGVYTSTYAPTHPIDEFLATDDFYLMVQRDSIIGPNSNKYRVLLLHDLAGTGVDTAAIVFESSVIAPASGLVSIDLIVMAEDVGHVVSDIQHIEIHQQSIAQAKLSESLGDEGMPYQGNIFIRMGIGAEVQEDSDQRFYNILGLNKFQQDHDSYELRGSDQDNPLQLKWKRPLQVLAKDCTYSIGPATITEAYQSETINTAAGFIVANNNNLTNLPRQLEVRLTNIPVKNFNGSQPNANTVSGSNIEEGLNRIVGTIPTPQPNNVSNNVDWVIQYEPFTPVYRPINNEHAFSINQLNIEVSYKDFNTGQRKTINNLDGTLALEFHVKPSKDEPKINNGLRPY